MSLVAYERSDISDSEDEGTSYFFSRTCKQKGLTLEMEGYDKPRLLTQDWNDKPRPPPLFDTNQSIAPDDET